MRKLVAIDSQVFIWGIKGEATLGQESKVQNTTAFFEHLKSTDSGILIPAPVIGEILVPVPKEQHGDILSRISRRMIIGSYDVAAASVFADMFAAYKNNEELRAYARQHKVSREHVKTDYMIAAIAVAQKAECIYSEDPHIKKFADGFIEVKDVPYVPYQTQIEFQPNVIQIFDEERRQNKT